MILEAIVTTLSCEGVLNIAPMGPQVETNLDRFVLRPFRTSTTYRNLKDSGEGVLHVTDDVLLLARSAIGQLVDMPTRPASKVRGRILETTGRVHEFRVLDLEDHDERTTIVVETLVESRQARGDLFGLNRAKHAVVEAAILATRLDFLPIEEVRTDFARLATLVDKTGGPDERLAFDLLQNHLQAWPRHRLGEIQT